MKILVKDYKPNEVLKFIRENSNLTQKEFSNRIGKSEDWQYSNEVGRANYYFKDLVTIAKMFDLEIIITDKKEKNLKDINS